MDNQYGQYNGYNNYNNNYNNNGRRPNTVGTPNVTPYIVWSVVVMVLCSRLLGIIALVLSILASSDVNSGKIASANDKLKWAKILIIIAGVLGLLGTLFIVGTYALGFLGMFLV